LLEVSTGLDEARVRPVAGRDGLVHAVLAALADREVRPEERTRPGVLAGQRERCQLRGLELSDVGQEIVPRCWRGRDPGLGELGLVVPEADHAQVERDAVLLAVDLVHAQGAWIDLTCPRRDVGGSVLHETGLLLLTQPAAAPRLEEVRRGAGLEKRRQLGLER